MSLSEDYEQLIGYADLDPVKRAASAAARSTSGNIADVGLKVIEWSRGESVFLVDHGDYVMGSLEEGLGTKNKAADVINLWRQIARMVARQMQQETGKTYYDSLAIDNIAMILNDMATLNVRPLVLNMHWAVGDSKFFNDEQRTADLIAGSKRACNIAGCTWGGGETPTLRDIVASDSILLSGSAYGWANPKTKLITPRVEPGDAIFILPSSGIMANGLTMAREVAGMLPFGYFTELGNGQIYGDAILTPTNLYGPLIQCMVDDGIDVHYTVNVTGHGWRKLMRLNTEVSYIVDMVPEPQEEFKLIQDVKHQTDKQMYETFNMGAGFAIYAPASHEPRISAIARLFRLNEVYKVGYVEAGPRQVVIRPLDIQWSAEDLGVR